MPKVEGVGVAIKQVQILPIPIARLKKKMKEPKDLPLEEFLKERHLRIETEINLKAVYGKRRRKNESSIN